MATVGTLFVNIAAKTSPFLNGVRGSMAQAKAATGNYSRSLAAFGRTTKSALTGETTYTAFSKLAARIHGVNPALGRGMFAMEKFGVSAGRVAGNAFNAFRKLGSFLGLGGFLSLAALGATVGAFITRTVKLSIARFREIRYAMFEITKTWRQIEFGAARAFAPAVMAVTQIVNSRLAEYLNGSSDTMKDFAQGALVVAGVVLMIADVVRIVWNIVTGLLKMMLAQILAIAGVILKFTDAVGLTDGAGTVALMAADDLAKSAIFDDTADIMDAGRGIGDTWSRTSQGVLDVQAGPGASGLTESGYGGSGALIDEARRQNAQLLRIENAITRSGGLT